MRRRFLVSYTRSSLSATIIPLPISVSVPGPTRRSRPHLYRTYTLTSNLNAHTPFLTHLPLIPEACSSLVGTADK